MQQIENILNVEIKPIDSTLFSNLRSSKGHVKPLESQLTNENECYRIDPNTQMVVHLVSSKDTLQGLAFKYGVTTSDLKRENKLATNDSFYSRKEIFIPTTQTQLRKTLEIQTHQREKENFELQQLTEQFVQQTSCTNEETAEQYLKRSSLNVQRAVEIYQLETQVQDSVRKLRAIANSRERIFPKPEATDTTKLLSPSASLYYHHSFDTTSRRISDSSNVSSSIDVRPVGKKKKSEMSASYNEIYDL